MCITKEADLICEMLSRGANPMDILIVESTEIRACALSLVTSRLCEPVAATASMMGIMKETAKICDWMSNNNMPFDPFDIDLHNDFDLGRQIRIRTLQFMCRILEKSSCVHPATAAGHKPVRKKLLVDMFLAMMGVALPLLKQQTLQRQHTRRDHWHRY